MEIRQSAAEDYLEAILMIKERKGYVRSIDVASQLGVTKPSVTYATKRLKENGYITMDEANMISLTDSGMAIANKIYTRHKVLTALFTHLGVDPELAREDACKVEHDLSEETFAALCKGGDICRSLQARFRADRDSARRGGRGRARGRNSPREPGRKGEAVIPEAEFYEDFRPYTVPCRPL